MIDNEFYKQLGEKWFTAEGDAIALLRRENLAKLPWVVEQIGAPSREILDVGCGGGFLTLRLASLGHTCTALDVGEEVLRVGRARDSEKKIRWVAGDALQLPFAAASFDVVCLMDVLEHVPDSGRALEEAARVLRPGGLLLAHTFNRTVLSWLFAAKGLDWFIKNSPAHIHDWKLFIRPSEMKVKLGALGFHLQDLRGIRPVIFSRAFFTLLLSGRVSEEFRFRTCGNLQIGYLLSARRESFN